MIENTMRNLTRMAQSMALAVAMVGTIPATQAQAEGAERLPGLPVPSSSPVTATTTDGWALTLAATDETTATVPVPTGVPPSEVIVGGTFSAKLRGPNGISRPVPKGSIEVGYEVQCVPAGLIAGAMSHSGVTAAKVLEEDFSNADPAVTVANFHLSIKCVGQAATRSYVILTHTTEATDRWWHTTGCTPRYDHMRDGSVRRWCIAPGHGD